MNWDYVAGFWDGEGTISAKLGKRGNPEPHISAAQSAPRAAVLREIQEFLSSEGIRSSITTPKGKSQYANHPVSVLYVLGDKQNRLKFLSNLRPKLHVKSEECRKVIYFILDWADGKFAKPKRKGNCVICGKPFDTHNSRRRFCAENCKAKAWYWANPVAARQLLKDYRAKRKAVTP